MSMNFSEREGIKEVNSTIQVQSINTALKIGLWNVFTMHYVNPIKREPIDSYKTSRYRGFIENIWFSFFKTPIDAIPYYKTELFKEIRDLFFSWEWYDIYEFIAKNPGEESSNNIADSFNEVLKRELSAYRFIGTELTPISDDNQISQIQKAINQTPKSKLLGVRIHLKTALEKLSDRKNPDYRNSIKESISAVESVAQVISGDDKAELGKALKIIKGKIGLHSALQQGFIKIYGYTSDGDGIRHSLLEETNLDLEDAIFMVTSCSAFINYLVVKADKAGIKLNNED